MVWTSEKGDHYISYPKNRAINIFRMGIFFSEKDFPKRRNQFFIRLKLKYFCKYGKLFALPPTKKSTEGRKTYFLHKMCNPFSLSLLHTLSLTHTLSLSFTLSLSHSAKFISFFGIWGKQWIMVAGYPTPTCVIRW